MLLMYPGKDSNADFHGLVSATIYIPGLLCDIRKSPNDRFLKHKSVTNDLTNGIFKTHLYIKFPLISND